MCERSPLFLFEVKSILLDLLTRTLELFDLSRRLLEHYRLSQFLLTREHQCDYRHFSLEKPCRLNYNIMSDLSTYLQRLYTTCRVTKSSLRSLHAARVTATNDYIVIDDEVYELIKFFKSKLNNVHSGPTTERKKSIKTSGRRYYSQRLVHNSYAIQSFQFHPISADSKNNSQTLESNESRQILQSFHKISRFFYFLLKQFYGVHNVQDSDVLQPIVISIIRSLLFITDELKRKLQVLSPIKAHNNRFRVQKKEEICQEQTTLGSSKPEFHIIETVKPVHENKVRNENHEENLLEFDEEEFYRLANLQRDD
ncbi:unnamed protein product [Adineta ricciae]|uniref:Uncharacterized protein n=1 Tax=Adineta ricciae TaxID=249248 RepID=A0A815DJI9_ADIRI|nr:unnamed protein product [Adineta ricciae]